MNRGSEWHKWDLHFHTPSSYDYAGKMKPERVERFRKLLEITEQYRRKNQYE